MSNFAAQKYSILTKAMTSGDQEEPRARYHRQTGCRSGKAPSFAASNGPSC